MALVEVREYGRKSSKSGEVLGAGSSRLQSWLSWVMWNGQVLEQESRVLTERHGEGAPCSEPGPGMKGPAAAAHALGPGQAPLICLCSGVRDLPEPLQVSPVLGGNRP